MCVKSMGREFVEQLETGQITAAEKLLECAKTTSNTVMEAELGMYPSRTFRELIY